ncbi:unnamed protein product, partial [Mesorhabditis spiculigera]
MRQSTGLLLYYLMHVCADGSFIRDESTDTLFYSLSECSSLRCAMQQCLNLTDCTAILQCKPGTGRPYYGTVSPSGMQYGMGSDPENCFKFSKNNGTCRASTEIPKITTTAKSAAFPSSLIPVPRYNDAKINYYKNVSGKVPIADYCKRCVWHIAAVSSAPECPALVPLYVSKDGKTLNLTAAADSTLLGLVSTTWRYCAANVTISQYTRGTDTLYKSNPPDGYNLPRYFNSTDRIQHRKFNPASPVQHINYCRLYHTDRSSIDNGRPLIPYSNGFNFDSFYGLPFYNSLHETQPTTITHLPEGVQALLHASLRIDAAGRLLRSRGDPPALRTVYPLSGSGALYATSDGKDLTLTNSAGATIAGYVAISVGYCGASLTSYRLSSGGVQFFVTSPGLRGVATGWYTWKLPSGYKTMPPPDPDCA